MTTQKFFVCDRCGIATAMEKDADVAGWRYVQSEGPGHGAMPSLFMAAMGREVPETPPEDAPQQWHLCPDCGKQLPMFFTSKFTEPATGVPFDV